MSLFNVEVEDNFDFDKKLPQLEKNVIHIAGQVGLRELSEYSPVDTGNLRDSWWIIEAGNVARIRNSAPYTVYVDRGTRYFKGYHFVELAVERVEEQSRDIVAQAMSKL